MTIFRWRAIPHTSYCSWWSFPSLSSAALLCLAPLHPFN